MKRQWFSLVITLSFCIFFTSCAAFDPAVSEPPATAPEYIRLTPQQAQDMMSDDVIILDVRTQEEFSERRIKNALLLPVDEIEEKASSVIPDKNQTVLVYCRTGRRSEIASRQLIEMGYTSVFDFGGIVDWTGAIVRR